MPEKEYSKELMQAMQRPLVKHSRLNPEMQAEVVDILIAAVDKFTDEKGPNTELATRLVKETLDRQYGGPWHCIMGEGFSFDVTAQAQLFTQENVSDPYNYTRVIVIH